MKSLNSQGVPRFAAVDQLQLGKAGAEIYNLRGAEFYLLQHNS